MPQNCSDMDEFETIPAGRSREIGAGRGTNWSAALFAPHLVLTIVRSPARPMARHFAGTKAEFRAYKCGDGAWHSNQGWRRKPTGLPFSLLALDSPFSAPLARLRPKSPAPSTRTN